jgi:hypothetical protein
MRRPLALAIAVAAAALAPAAATTYEVSPGADLQSSVDALAPGDELVLHGGTYVLSSRFSIQAVGTPTRPIVVRAMDGETPVVQYVDGSQNVINVENAAHLVLRGLTLTGGSHGIRISASNFVTVEKCHVHDVGDVGISANVPGSDYRGLRLLGNEIDHTGGTAEGMYLGCNSDVCRIHDSRIAGNHIHHTNGPGVTQGDGIEIKEGSYANTVADNVIHDTGYPCIITYSAVGHGGPNVLERNLLWACGDHAIQAAADAVIRNNLILGAVNDGIRDQPHQAGAPANLVIEHNTVLDAAHNALRVSGIVGSIVIANNALYAPNGYAIWLDGATGGAIVAGNVGDGATMNVAGGLDGAGDAALDLADADYGGAPPEDLFPVDGSRLVAAGSAAYPLADDFNGTPRAGTHDAGAYRWQSGGNPGWPLQAGFKPAVDLFADGFEGGNVAAWSAVVAP